MAGDRDLSSLFKRVSALEQEDADADQSITRIVKEYESVGISVSIDYRIHQFRICGDTNPIYGAVASASSYL
jgi:uncharacterized protein (UPF0335 family)